MAKKAKVKVKGVVLLEAFLALLLMAMASYGLASVNSVQFSQMAAGRESDSAKNYAELEAEYLKSLGFDAVVTNNKDDDDPSRTPRYPDGEQSSVDKASNARDMTKFLGDTLGSEWRSTATLGKTINNINGDSDNKIQNIVVSVYKKSDGDNASPRATVTLPLSSQTNGAGDSLPIGTILPYKGNLADIPKKWHLCDGTNGTPNLLDGRFLEGSSSIGIFKSAGLPNITGSLTNTFGHRTWYPRNASGALSATTKTLRTLTSGVDNAVGGYEWKFDASSSNPIYGASNTVQPRSYTVYFIMKIKK